VDPRVERVVARTTRQPRQGEVDGVDYVFLSVQDFERLIAEGYFLEYKKVFDNYYGTPLHAVDEILADGRIAILKIDVQGALSVMPLRPDALTVFLLPPSLEELKNRIEGRKSDTPEAISKRLAKATEEIAQACRYQHQIVNDHFQLAVQKLQVLASQ
jgi:guanylate kinase